MLHTHACQHCLTTGMCNRLFLMNEGLLSIISSRLFVCLFVCLFDLILHVPSTIFQLNRDGSSWVEPVQGYDKCVLLKDHNAVIPVRLEPAASRSRIKHFTTEPLRSLIPCVKTLIVLEPHGIFGSNYTYLFILTLFCHWYAK